MSILLLLAACGYGIRFARRGEFFSDSFSLSDTRAQKGFFAICVILHHLCTYLSDAYPSLFIFEHAGFLAVGGFFLISGFGLQYGVTHRDNYLHGFFRKRFATILVPYYIINLFYIASRYIAGALTKKYIILSLFGANLWYVTAILVLYLGFWLSFRIFGRSGGKYAVTVFCALYAAVLFVCNRFFGASSLGFWWYNSVICFVCGIWYCDSKEKIDRFLQKSRIWLFILAAAVFAVTYIAAAKAPDASRVYVLLCQVVCAGVFCILTAMLAMKIRIGNAFLNLCGDLSLELYLSHAILIFFFRSGITVGPYTIYLSSPDFYLTAILVGTLAMSVCVHFVSGKILGLINGGGKAPVKKA